MPTSDISKCDRDLAIFKRFLENCPDFTRIPIRDYRHSGLNQPPDIVATDNSGALIGVELVELLDRADRVGPDAGLISLLKPVMREELPGWGILLWPYDRQHEQWNTRTRRTLRSEFGSLLRSVKSSPATIFELDSRTLESKAPTLARLVAKLNFRLVETGDVELKTFRYSHPSSFSAEKSTELAIQRIKAKASKAGYYNLKSWEHLDQLVLLIHYDGEGQKGVPFNWLTDEIKQKLMSLLPGPFDLAFVFEDIPFHRGIFRKSIQIYP